MKLLSVVLLLLPLSACLAEVVNDFNASCPQFFPTVNGEVSPPTRFIGPRFKQICQTRNNRPEFATFYDTANRIPVYSSYGFYRRVSCTRKTGNWLIEPQLEVGGQGPNMASESTVGNVMNQARNGDYVGSVYDKGHLAPVYQASTQACSDATFTLTNAAPQHKSFNRGKWRVTEAEVANFLTTNCTNIGLNVYIVTGVVPGNTLLNRVRIPSHYWTAYCCLDQNNKPKLSGGYIGENVKNSVVNTRSRLQVENELNNLYGTNFILFGGGC